MTTDQTLHNIEEGKVVPFYFLYGSESFYRVEIIRALSKKLITLDNRDFNLENFEARETLAGDWVGAARTLSFMGGTKLIIVRNLHEAKLKASDQKILLDYLVEPALNSCFVITAEKADRKQKLYKTLTSQKGAVLCGAPRESELIPWLKRRARFLGYELNLEAAHQAAYILSCYLNPIDARNK